MPDVEFYRLYNGLRACDLMLCLCHDFCDFHKSLSCFLQPFLPWFSTVRTDHTSTEEKPKIKHRVREGSVNDNINRLEEHIAGKDYRNSWTSSGDQYQLLQWCIHNPDLSYQTAKSACTQNRRMKKQKRLGLVHLIDLSDHRSSVRTAISLGISGEIVTRHPGVRSKLRRCLFVISKDGAMGFCQIPWWP